MILTIAIGSNDKHGLICKFKQTDRLMIGLIDEILLRC
jgi:hypothetical protein